MEDGKGSYNGCVRGVKLRTKVLSPWEKGSEPCCPYYTSKDPPGVGGIGRKQTGGETESLRWSAPETQRHNTSLKLRLKQNRKHLPGFMNIKSKIIAGEPGWLSRLSVLLLIFDFSSGYDLRVLSPHWGTEPVYTSSLSFSHPLACSLSLSKQKNKQTKPKPNKTKLCKWENNVIMEGHLKVMKGKSS